MNKRLAFVHRFSLEGAAPGWGADCYIEYIPASYKGAAALVDLPEDMAQTEQAAESAKFLKQYVIGGKVRVMGEDGKIELADLELEQVAELPLAVQKELVAAVIGGTLDPKDSAESGDKPSSADDAPTET